MTPGSWQLYRGCWWRVACPPGCCTVALWSLCFLCRPPLLAADQNVMCPAPPLTHPALPPTQQGAVSLAAPSLPPTCAWPPSPSARLQRVAVLRPSASPTRVSTLLRQPVPWAMPAQVECPQVQHMPSLAQGITWGAGMVGCTRQAPTQQQLAWHLAQGATEGGNTLSCICCSTPGRVQG